MNKSSSLAGCVVFTSRARRCVACLTSVLALAWAGDAQAQSTWTTAGSGTWTVSGNWTGGLPTSSSAVTFNTVGSSGAETIYLNGAESAASLTFQNTGSTTLLGGTSTTPAANTLTLSSGITVNSGAGVITIGDTSVTPTAQVNLALSASQSFTNNSSNTLTIANGVTSSATTGTQTLTTAGSGNETFGGVIGNGSTNGTIAFTQNGTGTVTLNGADTYTGATTVNNGTLADSNTLASTALVLGGGIFSNTSASTNQTFTTTTLNAGGSGVGNSSTGTVALGTITRNAGATLNISNTSSGNVTAINANTNGILGGYATYGGTAFAVSAGTGSAAGNLSALSPSIVLGTGGDTTTSDNDKLTATGTQTQTAASTINSLTITSASGTLALGTNPLTFTTTSGVTGGLLYAGGGNYTISGSGAGVLGAGSTSEAIINVSSGGNLSISAPLVSATATAGTLTMGGTGTLTITGNQVYTGQTTVGAGTLNVGGGGAVTLGASGTYAGAIVINGGNFNMDSTANENLGTASSTSITGSGSFTQSGSGTTTIYQNNITGPTLVSAGVLAEQHSSTTSSLTVTGGTFSDSATTGSGAGLGSVNLGAASGTGTATLEFTTNVNLPNPINVVSGTSGTIEIWDESGSATVSGAVTLANNLTLYNNNSSSSTLTVTGGISGTGNVIVDGTAAGSSFSISGSPLSFTGTLSNISTNASGTLNLSANLTGSESLLENSPVNAVTTVSGTNTNTGTTTVQAGTLDELYQVSLYNNGASAAWSGSNILVQNGGTLALGVGAATGQFTTANITTLLGLSTSGSTGFESGSSIGFDTTNAVGGTYTLGNVIANTNGGANILGLAKLGTGTLVISNLNTYTGPTTIYGGALQLANTTANNGGIISSGTVVLSGGALQAGSAAALTISNPISLAASSTISGAQSLTLTGGVSQTTNGSTTLTSSITNGNTLTIGTGNVNIDAVTGTGLTLTMNGTGVTTVNSVIQDYSGGVGSSHGALTYSGTGVLALTNQNTYLGTTTLSGGTLILSGGTSTLGTLANTAADSIVISGGTLQLQANGTNTTGGHVSNALTASTTGSGGSTGVSSLGSATVQLLSNSSVTFNGFNGVQGVNGTTSTFFVNELNNSGTSGQTMTVAPVGFQVGGNATWNITGANSDSLSIGTISDVSTGTFTLNPTTANVTLAGFGATTGTDVLALSGTSGSNIVSGAITTGGTSVAVTKSGPSTWTLQGANTYTGATTVNGGTLILSNGTQASTSLALGGGTLSLTATSPATVSYSSNTTVNAGGSAVSAAAGDTIKLGTITRAAGGTLNFSSTGTITTTQANVNSILGGYATYGSGTSNVFAVSGASATVGVSGLANGPALTATGDTTTSDNDSLSSSLTLNSSVNPTINTLTINDTTPGHTLALGGNNLTFTYASATSLGGLLYNGGQTYSITGTGVVGGTTNTSELVVNVSGTGNLTIAAPVVSATATAGILTMGGTGTLTLTANNVYTGGTNIGQGTLVIGGSSQLDGGVYAGAIADSGVLNLGTSANQILSGVISGGGGVTQSGTGTTILTNTNTYMGTTSITAGTLAIGNQAVGGSGSLGGGTYSGNISDNGTLIDGSSTSQTWGGAISGSGTLTQMGASTLTISNLGNTYSGAVVLNAGTLSLSGILNNSSVGALTLGGGTLAYAEPGTGVSQTFNGTTINPGASAITESSAGQTINLGAITANAGGVVDFSTNGVITTTNTTNTNGILGGWATYGGGATWAVAPSMSGGAITGLANTAYTETSSALNAPGSYLNQNIDVNSSQTLTGATNPNSLRFSSATSYTLTLTGLDQITSGGILASGTGGGNITGGTLLGTPGAGGELVIDDSGAGTLTFNTTVEDNGGPTAVVKAGATNILWYDDANEAFSGGLYIEAGTVYLDGGTGYSSGALGSGNITFGTSGSPTLNIRANNGTVFNVGLLTGANTNGNIEETYTNNAEAYLALQGTGTATYNGASTQGGTNSRTVGIIMNGSGTQILGGTNLVGIQTLVADNGTLQLGNGTSTSPSLDNAVGNALYVGGGTFAVLGSSSSTYMYSASPGTLTVAPGGSTISVNANGGGGTLLTLGAITTNTGGTVNFVLPSGTQSATNGITTTTANVGNSILGGYATVNGTDWADNNGTDIVALPSYTNDTWGASNNTTVTTNDTPSSGSTTYSLRFASSTTDTVTLAGTNIITSGGILVSSGVGGFNETITGGTLEGLSNTGLIVNQFNTSGALTINSIIANNGTTNALTLSGGGKLILGATNTFTGGIFLNNGVLNASGTGTNIPTTGTLAINGGTLQASGALTVSNAVTLAAAGGTIDTNGGNTVALNGIISNSNAANGSSLGSSLISTEAGTLTKIGVGTLQLGGTNTWTGGLTINNGTVQATANHAGSLGAGLLTFGTSNTPTLDLDGANSPTVAGIAGSGTNGVITNTGTGTSTITLNGYFDQTFNGTIKNGNAGAGVVALTLNLGNTTLTQTLGGANTFTGSTTISSGYLQLGNANSLVGSNVSIGQTNGLTFSPGIGTFNVAGIAGSSNEALADTGGGAVTLVVGANNTSSTYYGILSGAGSLTKLGTGTLELGGGGVGGLSPSTYTGVTTVNAGVLQVGDGLGDGGITSSSGLVLGGGTLYLLGNTGNNTAVSATFGALTVNAGKSAIQIYDAYVPSYTESSTVTLGAITHNTGGTVDFAQLNSPTNPYDSITTTTANTAGSILGGWATANGGTTWATSAGSPGNPGAITGITSYTETSAALNVPANYTGNNMDVNSSQSPTAGVTMNSLRFNTATAYTLTLTGTNTITSGGILITPTATLTNTITGGTLEAGSSNELFVDGSNNLTIGSVIADNGNPTAFTVGDTSTVTLTGVNTYTGQTTVGGGTLTINGAGQLGSGSYAGAMVVQNGTFIYNSTATQTLSGAISGNGAVTDSGSGTLTLAGANSYSGTTTVSAGVLSLTGTNTSTGATTVSGGVLQLGNTTANDGGLASGALTLSGGALQATSVAALSINNPVSLTASSTISGTQNLTLTGGVSQTASTTLTSSDTGSTGLTISTGAVNIDAVTGTALTLTLNGAGNTTINSVIQDYSGGVGTSHGALTYSGTGSLTLAGADTYGGATTVSNGTLVLTTGGSLANTASVTTSGTGVFSETSGGIIGGAATFTQGSTRTSTLAGANTYTGLTTVSAGTLNLTGSNTSAGATTVSGGTLGLGTGSDGGLASGLLTLGGGTLQASVASVPTITNAVSLTANSTIAGAQNLTLGGVLTNTGANNTLTINNTGSTTISGGNVYLSEASATGRTLTINGTGNVTIGDTIANYSGSGQPGGLTYGGSGTLTLTGANTYTGATTVNGGTLQVNGATGSINSGSTLTLGGGTFSLLGAATGNTGQTFTNALTTTAGTASAIALTPQGSGTTTLTLSSASLASIGAGSSINFNLTAGTTNATTSTLGNTVVAWGPSLTGSIIGGGFTVTDSGGAGYATVSGGDVIRWTDPGSDGLPVSGGSSTGNYWVDSTYSPTFVTTVAGSLKEALSGADAANTISVNTGASGGSGYQLAIGANTLTITSGGGMLFTGASPYTVSATGAGNITTSSGGAIVFNNYDSSASGVTISAPILNSGAGTVTFAGNSSSLTTLTGANTYTGVTTVGGGTVQVGNGTSGVIAGNAAVSPGATLAFDEAGGSTYSGTINDNGTVSAIQTGSLTLGGAIGGTGGVTQSGTGVTILNTGNTFTGPTLVSAGTLQVKSSNSTSSITVTGGTYNLNTNNASALGTGPINLGGSGTTTATFNYNPNATGNYSNPINILAGTSGQIEIENTSGTLTLSGAVTLANNLTLLNTNSNGGSTLTLTGGISGTGNVIVDGTSGVGLSISGSPLSFTGTLSNISTSVNGTLALSANLTGAESLLENSPANAVTTVSGVNTNTGTTAVDQGTMDFTQEVSLYNDQGGALAGYWNASNITVQPGATLAFGVGNAAGFTATDLQTLSGLGTATGGFENDSFIGIDTTGGNFTYGNVIANPNSGANVLGLTKLGSNTLTLTANNTYTGLTTISAGTLQIGNGGTTGTLGNGGSGTVTDNGTLLFNRTDNYGGAMNYSIGGSGGLTLAGGALTLSAVNTFSGATTVTAGTLDLKNSLALENSAVAYSTGITFDSSVASNAFTFGSLTGNPNITLQNTTGAGITLTLGSMTNQNTTETGNLLASASGNGGALTVFGVFNTITLTGTNTYTGATTIEGSTLNLGNGTASGSINSSSALVLNGGTLAYTVTGGATQSFNGTTILPGASAITESLANQTINLGAISRTLPGSVVDFGSTGTITTTTTTNTNGIMGGWATYGGKSTWAVAPSTSGGAITGLSSYTASVAGTTAPGSTANVDFQASNTTNWNTQTINSLRFNQATGPTLTIAANNALTISSGGILVTPNQTGTGSTITGGTLMGGANGELDIISGDTYTNGGTGASALNIASLIQDNVGASAVSISGTNNRSYIQLSNVNNSFSGGLFINTGEAVGGSSGTSLGTGNITFGLDVFTGSNGALALNGTNTTATGLLVDADGVVGTNGDISNAGGVYTLNLIGTGTATFNGIIGDYAPGRVDNVVLESGTQIFGNTNVGSTLVTVNGGTLQVGNGYLGSFSNTYNNVGLVVGGGTYLQYGAFAGLTSQTYNSGLAVNSGNSTITVNNNSAGGTVLNLNAITPSVGGTVNFNLPSGTQNILNGVTTTTLNTNGILGGYATVGGTDWAANATNASGGNIVGLSTLSGYTASTAGTTAPGTTANVDFQASNTNGWTTQTVNSLRFNTAAADTLTVAASNTLTLASGGILITPNVGSNLSTITGGTLTSTAALAELNVIQNNTSAGLTIGSVISGSIALDKSGAGLLTLTNANTYTGGLYLNGGILNAATTNINGSSATNGIFFNGGTLQAAAGGISTAKAVSVGVNGGTFDLNGNSSTLSGSITQTSAGNNLGAGLLGAFDPTGEGLLTVSDSGAAATLTLSGGSNAYYGGLAINGNSTVQDANAAAGTLGSGFLTFGTSGAPTVDLDGHSPTVAGLIGSGTNGVITSSVTGTPTLTLDGTLSETYNGVIQNGGAGAVVGLVLNLNNPTESQTLGGANTYTGATTITSGTLIIAGTGVLGGGNYAGALTDTGGFIYNSSSRQTLSGTISGAGAFTQGGSGFLTVSGTTNSNTGVISATGVGGTLEFTNVGALNNYGTITGSNLIVGNGATLALGVGASPTYFTASNISTLLANVGGSATSGFENGSILGLDTTNATGGTFTYGTAIANPYVGGTLGLTKLGVGTLILTANNTYTGGTTVNGGILAVNNTTGTGTGSGSLVIGGSTASGTPTLAGSGTISSSGSVEISSANSGAAGVVNPGAVAGAGSTAGYATLTFQNGLEFQSGSTYLVDIGGSSGDSLSVTGGLTLDSGSILNFDKLGALTQGNYVLASDDTLSGTFTTISNTPTGYSVIYSGSNVDLQHNAALVIAATTPTSVNAHVGSSTTIGVSVGNTAPSGGASLTYNLSGAITATPASPSLTAGATGAASGPAGTYAASSTSYSVTSAGPTNLSVTATDTSNALDTGSVSYTVTGYNLASANTITPTINLGYVHQGGSFGTSTLTIQNTATAGSYSEDLAASATPSGSASASGSISNLLAGGTSTAISVGLGGSANTGTAGTVSGTVAIGLTSTGTVNGVSDGLSTTPLTGQSVAVSGNVYSGQSTWTTNGSGSWGTFATGFGANWGATQGSPGLDAGFANTDTATFGSATTSGTGTISLNGASPSLKAITFNDSAANYDIVPGSGGSIALSGNGGNATVTDTAGTNAVIGTNVSLTTSANVNVASGQQLNLSGVISGSGTGLSVITGSGTTILSGTTANTYTGQTTVSSGVLELDKTAGVVAIAGAGAENISSPDILVNGGELKFLTNDQLGNSVDSTGNVTLSITSGGLVDLYGTTQTLYSYKNSGGTIESTNGRGTLIGTGATATFDGGTNNIAANTTVEDTHIAIGPTTTTTVTVHGSEGNGVGANGILQLNGGGTGMQFSNGSTLNLNSDNQTAGTLALGGSGATSISVLDATSNYINSASGGSNAGNVALNGHTAAFSVASSGSLTVGAVIVDGTSSGAISKAGAGALILTNANTYSGGTTVTAGNLYVNNTTGSGTGTGSVSVSNSGTTLAGTGSISGAVSLSSGSTLYSGGLASGTPAVSANTSSSTTGLTLSSSLGVNSANLTFALGTDTTSGGSSYNFANPSYNSTYMNVGGVVTFSGSDSVSLVDLTNTTGTNGSLTLRTGTPYVLIHDSMGDAGFSGLVTVSGFGANTVYTLDGNGYVVGVADAGWAPSDGSTDTTAIQINQFGANGVTALTPGNGGIYNAPVLYLENGNLEVVPEPGTWALMIGGLALLIIIQRRRAPRS